MRDCSFLDEPLTDEVLDESGYGAVARCKVARQGEGMLHGQDEVHAHLRMKALAFQWFRGAGHSSS